MSSELTVFGPMYKDPPPNPYRFIQGSCAKFGIPFYGYADGEQWPWYLEGKIRRPLKEIANITTPYVMFVDTRDSFLMAGEDEILAKFRACGADLLCATEFTCWPDVELKPLYPPAPTRFAYAQGGGRIGTHKAMATLFQTMDNMSRELGSRDDDQYWVTRAFLDGFPMMLDYHCEVFQTMAAQPGIKWEGNRIRNTETGSLPIALHFAGRTAGIEDYYKLCFGEDA